MINQKMVTILERQLEPTLQMLEQLVEVCSEEIWQDQKTLYWKHILHAITGIEFWFRQEGEQFHLPDFNKDVTPDFDKECKDHPTKYELAKYINEMKQKSQEFFNRLNDELLLEPCDIYNKITKADAILMQVRHIQHHIGYCNNILSARKNETVKWLGHGE
ncbi:hypothetical protein J2Z22_000388 [Paenibacillus forsythiae]|uniref:DinB-like domain-containing protein n=1 Tax=Paenibacillus forsythiae TaxID=365616 RepID=A0ABU3H338_9BACL|nr:DinB family protein [Paenibacillus forsythiae]MDT3424876.1 hypothetical protein [Paenibacillus forsythiae]